MEHIDQNNLLAYLNGIENQSSNCDYNVYKEWSNVVEGHDLDLAKVGAIEQEVTEEQTDYWGEEAPIRLNVYPYYRCEIHQCPKSKQLFFFYRELSWHRPQNRYRLIQKELIDIESIVPTAYCEILSKPLHYTLCKLKNMHFELSIYKPVNLEAQVYHILTDEEVKQFKENGITALENRIKDMNENHANYRVVSWQ